ncbi:hypothetical protein [uncultured Intestinimonas sp.]|uniref:hypothetical protein n=1 Tax=uncultured Intestinimonas sp. TaxID=1689265 RepID=UPI0025FC28B0|nr:hypothetical protein [uncultured Intestinimonas sp.]
MFHLMPVRLWRRISMALALLSVGAALVGSLLLDGPLTIRWGREGAPSGTADVWVLWGLAALAVLSMFTYGSFRGRSPGSAALGEEMACALATELVGVFALAAVAVTAYGFLPWPEVPAAALAAVLGLLAACPLTAWIRERKGRM